MSTEFIHLLLMELTRRTAELPWDITTDRPVNERILGISAEAPEKYVGLTFDGGPSWQTVIIYVALRLVSLARMDGSSLARGRGEGGTLTVAPVRARRCG
jgi:hypothetical protein